MPKVDMPRICRWRDLGVLGLRDLSRSYRGAWCFGWVYERTLIMGNIHTGCFSKLAACCVHERY